MELDSWDKELNPPIAATEFLTLHETPKMLIYSWHALIMQLELHLDGITTKYKSIALTLLLAIYAAIGFLFSAELKDVQINLFITMSFICICGFIGINSIWFLDMHVFQNFWGAFFIEGVKMENKHDFLVRLGDSAIALNNIQSRIKANKNFYIFINTLLIVTCATALIFIFSSFSAIMVIVVVAFLLIYSMVIVIHTTGNTLEKKLKALMDQK